MSFWSRVFDAKQNEYNKWLDEYERTRSASSLAQLNNARDNLTMAQAAKIIEEKEKDKK